MEHPFFIEQLAGEILAAPQDSRNLHIVFQNRRPAAFLLHHLQKQSTETLWSPQMWSIDDLVQTCARLVVPDQLTLVLKLWPLYQKLAEEADIQPNLEHFIPIGQTLLADFDAIDKQLADTTALFANLASLRKLEETFEPKEQIRKLQALWKQFSDQDSNSLKKQFKQLWQSMVALYQQFTQQLLSEKMGYQGLLMRQLAEANDDPFSQFTDKDSIWVCGFNAMSTAETAIFNRLEQRCNVRYFTDADRYYLHDENHEAGHFVRSHMQQSDFAPVDLLRQSVKNISVYGVSGISGMAQMANNIVQQWPESAHNARSAIVLADEKGLQPLLLALSGRRFPLNITMGYPAKFAPVVSILTSIAQLHVQQKGKPGQEVYYHQPLISLLENPTWGQTAEMQNAIQHIKKHNMVWVSFKWLKTECASYTWLLQPAHSPKEMLDKLQNVLTELSKLLQQKAFELEILQHVMRSLNRLNDLLADITYDINLSVFQKLLRSVLGMIRVPFEGEPLEGLQIMGFLETRALDFDRLIILSVNEGILPATAPQGSLIPFGIRKAFGLNTYHEVDAIYAYHFYRLLQRAKEVHLLYNTDSQQSNKAEVSRFVLQLKHELLPQNAQITWRDKIVNLHTEKRKVRSKQVEKTPEIMAELQAYTAANEDDRKMLSPSALSTYIKSPLQFYFRYLAKVPEPEELEEELSPIDMGQIVHNTLESLYTPYIGETLTPEHFSSIQQQLSKTLRDQLHLERNLEQEQLEGKNLLLFDVCQLMCQNVLDHDAKISGLRILALEQDDLTHPFTFNTQEGARQVWLQGKFDRIDEVEGQLRIVDYKTGRAKIDKTYNDGIFRDPKKAAFFQTLFYAYVYLQHQPASTTVLPLVYKVDQRQELEQCLKEPISLEQMEPFTEGLADLLAEIWHPAVPFMHDEDRDLYLTVPTL